MKIDRMVLLWLYPRLRELPPETWDVVVARARGTDFDTVEWVAVIGGVVVVAGLLGAELSTITMQQPFVVHLLRYLLALPLLAAFVGPLYLRRTRRGLERELARRNARTGNAEAFSDRKEA